MILKDLTVEIVPLNSSGGPILTLFGKVNQNIGGMANALDEVLQTDMLVRRVDSIAGVTDASGDNWQAQRVDERVVWSTATDHRSDDAILTVNGLGRAGGQLDKRVIGRDSGGPCTAMVLDFDVAESLLIEMVAKLLHDIVWILIGNQSKVYLGPRFGWQDSLGAGPLIAGAKTTNRTTWLKDGRAFKFHATGEPI